MSRVYVCQHCGLTVSKFFVHHCQDLLTKVEETPASKRRTPAADDVDTISKRLEELRKEREAALNAPDSSEEKK